MNNIFRDELNTYVPNIYREAEFSARQSIIYFSLFMKLDQEKEIDIPAMAKEIQCTEKAFKISLDKLVNGDNKFKLPFIDRREVDGKTLYKLADVWEFNNKYYAENKEAIAAKYTQESPPEEGDNLLDLMFWDYKEKPSEVEAYCKENKVSDKQLIYHMASKLIEVYLKQSDIDVSLRLLKEDLDL